MPGLFLCKINNLAKFYTLEIVVGVQVNVSKTQNHLFVLGIESDDNI